MEWTSIWAKGGVVGVGGRGRGSDIVEGRRKATAARKMIEVVLNNRLGKKVKVKCNEDDTISDLKKMVTTRSASSSCTTPKDHVTFKDYEIPDSIGLELYYN
ncbi:hypothetical protein RJ639_010768 [Escallonia herrerae]|uniref:Ubiquitin-like protein 5 n=1 Tax=Escallonia herrerae TaxID=1293975 RepID=A0AA89AQ94_9ASTE|nr:hypothetical protein RJ639_010768 [Escallonia herrerae]